MLSDPFIDKKIFFLGKELRESRCCVFTRLMGVVKFLTISRHVATTQELVQI